MLRNVLPGQAKRMICSFSKFYNNNVNNVDITKLSSSVIRFGGSRNYHHCCYGKRGDFLEKVGESSIYYFQRRRFRRSSMRWNNIDRNGDSKSSTQSKLLIGTTGFSLGLLGFLERKPKLSPQDELLMEIKRGILAMQVKCSLAHTDDRFIY
jgi:hypothetical protein